MCAQLLVTNRARTLFARLLTWKRLCSYPPMRIVCSSFRIGVVGGCSIMGQRFLNSDHTFALCAYGESPYLEECLASLIAQTVKTNILIATSTPNDHIETIARRYGVPLHINDGAPGISHDWNCAVSHCKTPLVTIAHQDDVYLPSYAEAVLNSVNGSGRPLIFFTNYGEIRDGRSVDDVRILKVKRLLLSPLKIRCLRKFKAVKRGVLSLGSSICCPSVTLCLPNLSNPIFLEGMRCNLDWEAWERASRREGEFLYDQRILMRHRIHEGSETTSLIENDVRSQEDYVMLCKFWPSLIARAVWKFYVTSQSSNSCL